MKRFLSTLGILLWLMLLQLIVAGLTYEVANLSGYIPGIIAVFLVPIYGILFLYAFSKIVPLFFYVPAELLLKYGALPIVLPIFYLSYIPIFVLLFLILAPQVFTDYFVFVSTCIIIYLSTNYVIWSFRNLVKTQNRYLDMGYDLEDAKYIIDGLIENGTRVGL